MRVVTGKSVSPGYAQGHAVVLGNCLPVVTERVISPEQVDAELERFHSVLEHSSRELSQLQARVQSELGSASADIFSAHMLFLRDPQFIDRVEACIRDDHFGLESAIQVTIDELANLLSQADNAYLRERAADIRDLRRRLLCHVTQSASGQLARLSSASVLVVRELLPSDLLEFDREHLAGIVTGTGGETGHATILARALGIPAVTGICDATDIIRPGTEVLVDGQNGTVILEPGPEQLRASIADKERYDRVTKQALSVEQNKCRTQDGVAVSLLANIGRSFEAPQVVQHHLEGVGLFRTEYLFLDQAVEPSFERQLAAYQQIARSLDGLPLMIRTLDLGGDKWPSFLDPRFEANPNLGVRGLRFSLFVTGELFRTQIRAALHVSREHDVRILLPMIMGPDDLREAIAIIRGVADGEGLNHLPPVGALVETPAAVFAIREILEAADFISIGTNDLTQFMLAADRNALALIDDYTVLHPSVLRAVHHVIEAANAAGKSATLCGEAAADPRVACLFVGLGATSLSMNPVSSARVRYAVRSSRYDRLKELAQQALKSDSARSVTTLALESLQDTYPEYQSEVVSV